MADRIILIPRPLGSLCLPEENMILQRKFIHSFFISHEVDLYTRTLNAQNYREGNDFKKFTKD